MRANWLWKEVDQLTFKSKKKNSQFYVKRISIDLKGTTGYPLLSEWESK